MFVQNDISDHCDTSLLVNGFISSATFSILVHYYASQV